MVVGNGLVARSLEAFHSNDDVIIFASGVSNSGERDPAAFARERQLLSTYLDRPECLVYFSSCSIYDPSLVQSPYVQHKHAVEQLIRETAERYLIVRLPNLVGETDNPNTLFNYLRNRLISGEEINLHTKACRYLVDTDDLDWMVTMMLDGPQNRTINACFDNRISIPELLAAMETATGKTARVVTVEKGSCYPVAAEEFQSLLNQNNRIIDPAAYNHQLVEKYS